MLLCNALVNLDDEDTLLFIKLETCLTSLPVLLFRTLLWLYSVFSTFGSGTCSSP